MDKSLKGGQLGVRGRDLFPHSYSCQAGLSGMRFHEGGRDVVDSEQLVKHSSNHKTRAATIRTKGAPVPP